MEPGIYYDIPFNEYLKIDAFSKSLVYECLKSPKHLKHCIDSPEESTKIMDFGSLVDCMVFEPGQVKNRFAMIPEKYINSKKIEMPFTMQSNTCKAIIAGIESSGKTAMKAVDFDRAEKIFEEIKSHPEASKWVSLSRHQVTIIWTDPETKTLCKGRMDGYIDKIGEQRIVDLKITENPFPGAFSRIANQFNYHVQGAMYHHGLYCAVSGKYPDGWVIPFSLIVAESEQPHETICYNMDSESLDVGVEKFKRAIQVYVECKENNEWPGYSSVAEELKIPMWAINRLMLEGVYE